MITQRIKDMGETATDIPPLTGCISVQLNNSDAIAFWLGTGSLRYDVTASYTCERSRNEYHQYYVKTSYDVVWAWVDMIDARDDLPGAFGWIEKNLGDRIGDRFLKMAYSIKIYAIEQGCVFSFFIP